MAKDVRALLHARAAVCVEACMCVFDVDNRLVCGQGGGCCVAKDEGSRMTRMSALLGGPVGHQTQQCSRAWRQAGAEAVQVRCEQTRATPQKLCESLPSSGGAWTQR